MLKVVESACAGNPDKVCDQVAEAIVDECLRRDPKASVDLCVMGSHGMMMVAGELDSAADFDLSALAKKTYAEIGYTDEIEVFVNVEKPSDEMRKAPRGASDLVVVRGYATRETRERLPRAVVYAHELSRRLDDLRRLDPAFSWLRPDGKVQVTLDGARVAGVTVLASHARNMAPRDVQGALIERLIVPVFGVEPPQMSVNPIGPFTAHGFRADSGMSGRKAASDTYGGLVPGFDTPMAGKDPYKASRCGAYLARTCARSFVDQGLCDAATVTVAYALGRAEPVAIEVRGVGEKAQGAKMDLTAAAKRAFDFRPEAIVERLSLERPMYRDLSVYGAFGRPGTPWEDAAMNAA
ncbi:hypothetical protein EPO34_01990 [Patescibacteria group bacterium]|nr:MAG: hypothetical protein EPO34_01990 [Patescibacteria group bacterium]